MRQLREQAAGQHANPTTTSSPQRSLALLAAATITSPFPPRSPSPDRHVPSAPPVQPATSQPPRSSPITSPRSISPQEFPVPASRAIASDDEPSSRDDTSDSSQQSVAAGSAPMPPSSVEQVVTRLFADMSREVVILDEHDPQRNAGEMLPEGVTTLLEALGSLDGDDLFLDIGSGHGNIVAQVALGTNAYKAIRIELRRDLHCLAMTMMTDSAHGCRLRDRTEFYRRDVSNMHISYTPPFANTTVIYWNNVLFEPSVVENVKEGHCGMLLLRFLGSCLMFCPKDLCHNAFCVPFELVKELQLEN